MNSLANVPVENKVLCEPCTYLRKPQQREAVGICEIKPEGAEYYVCKLHMEWMLENGGEGTYYSLKDQGIQIMTNVLKTLKEAKEII